MCVHIETYPHNSQCNFFLKGALLTGATFPIISVSQISLVLIDGRSPVVKLSNWANQSIVCIDPLWIQSQKYCKDSLIGQTLGKLSQSAAIVILIILIMQPQLKWTTFSYLSRLCWSYLDRFSRGRTSLTSLSIFQFSRSLMVDFPWCLEIFTTLSLLQGALHNNLSKSQGSKISLCKVELQLAHVG